MKTYIGTKIIQAEPEGKDGKDGYKVVYPDGYTSWSPKEVFEGAYFENKGLSFGMALEAIKNGSSVRRAGWNGKDMSLILKTGSHDFASKGPIAAGENISGVNSVLFDRGDVGTVTRMPHINMMTADGCIVAWLASQSDMLATDWRIVE